MEPNATWLVGALWDGSARVSRPDAGKPITGEARFGATKRSNGDVHARLTKLVEENYRSIYNLIHSYIAGEPEEAEDLTLQTFENAFAAAGRFRGDADVRTWVFRIAINVCKNRIRHRQTRRKVESFSLDAPVTAAGEEGGETVEVADESLSPAGVAEARELRQVLRQAIGELPEDYRTVLLLKLEDLSYKEIADVLGVTVETIKSRLFRARWALKQKVSHYVDGI
jgi:RNA polymerase sigma-70 factor, ECF subfamily